MDWIRSRELLEEKGEVWTAQTAILDLAESEKRSLTADERETYDKYDDRMDEIDADLERFKKAEKRSASMADIEDQLRERIKPGTDPDDDNPETLTREAAELEQRSLDAYSKFLASGDKTEYRALQADSDVEGGYLIAPEKMVAGLIQAADDATFIRELAHVESLSAAGSLGVPTLDTDLGDADWTQEVTPVTNDEGLRVGKRELHPQYISKLTKLSRPLVRRTRGGAETLVRARLGYKFGITEEKGYLTGNGANQPLGVFTASNDGISTGRDMATDNTTTAITADGLMNAKYNVKASYWPGSTWLFHRDAVREIRKLKDANDQYIWRPGLVGGQPDVILDSPFKVSEYVPNTFTTGLYVGIYGNFEWYWIAEVFGLEVQVLLEKYAEENKNGYIGRRELDGMPVLEEAFTRVTLA